MKTVKGTKTEKNLLTAFAGESQARNRYTYFASQAKKEGYEQIAALFLETAENEKEHAKRFFKFLEGGDLEITACFPSGRIGTTAENLLAAAMGEHEEHTLLYPGFAAIAQEAGAPSGNLCVYVWPSLLTVRWRLITPYFPASELGVDCRGISLQICVLFLTGAAK